LKHGQTVNAKLRSQPKQLHRRIFDEALKHP
jgi:hypothetical protein